MSRVTFIAFLAALSGPLFGQAPGVSSKTNIQRLISVNEEEEQ